METWDIKTRRREKKGFLNANDLMIISEELNVWKRGKSSSAVPMKDLQRGSATRFYGSVGEAWDPGEG